MYKIPRLIAFFICPVFLVPSRPPPNVRVENFFSTVVVTWDPLHENDANGEILGYTVYYRERWYYNIKSLNTSDTEVILSNLTAGKSYEFSVSAFTSVGEGPRSAWHTITVGKAGALKPLFVSLFSSAIDTTHREYLVGTTGLTHDRS